VAAQTDPPITLAGFAAALRFDLIRFGGRAWTMFGLDVCTLGDPYTRTYMLPR